MRCGGRGGRALLCVPSLQTFGQLGVFLLAAGSLHKLLVGGLVLEGSLAEYLDQVLPLQLLLLQQTLRQLRDKINVKPWWT